ncbi:MAG: response regulator [Acidobacteria bacterium]|nr:response regulator [Acidobacteriota bacterium]MBI3662462.1 response regulator [Acidobacteriota bacterium]
MKVVRVLIVEDNPMVLDLISKGLSPHCELATAADGADALLKVIDDPPDMIISDYKMPGLDGRQLYEKLRGRERTRGLPFIFMAGRADIEEKLRPLVDGVEDFIVKPFFLKEFVRRAKKVVDRLQLEKMQQRSARPGTIQGRLEEMSIMDLLQSLEMGQKSCRLTIVRGDDKCEMFFTGGVCKHAQLGSVEGNEAVFKAAAWSDGEFEIDFNANSDKVTCTMSTQGLLMEAFRLMDEASRDMADAQG